MVASLARSGPESRAEPRDEVLHRARAMRRDGSTVTITIVNLSPHGLMARCEDTIGAGERLSVMLPVAGLVRAEVRWALGGRIGCQLDVPIAIGRYYELLAQVRG